MRGSKATGVKGGGVGLMPSPRPGTEAGLCWEQGLLNGLNSWPWKEASQELPRPLLLVSRYPACTWPGGGWRGWQPPVLCCGALLNAPSAPPSFAR